MSNKKPINRGKHSGAFPAMRACPLCDHLGQPAKTDQLIKALQLHGGLKVEKKRR